MNHTPKLPELTIPAHLTVRMTREMTTRNTDLRSTESYVSALPTSTRSRHHALVNATRTHQDTVAVIDFYSRRYNKVPAAAPVATSITAHDAEQQIIDAGVPYSYVRGMLKGGVALTREYVADQIKSYFALKAITEQRNAARLAQVMQRSA